MVTKAKINFNDNNYPDLGSITADATRIFMYESSSDTWYELG